MILVCAVDDFRKFRKIRKIAKCQVFGVFKSTRQVCNPLYLNSIKTALKTLIFFKKLIFAFLNPKIVKW